jgi:hypothetical protein
MEVHHHPKVETSKDRRTSTHSRTFGPVTPARMGKLASLLYTPDEQSPEAKLRGSLLPKIGNNLCYDTRDLELHPGRYPGLALFFPDWI